MAMVCECWSSTSRCQPCRDQLFAQLKGVAMCRGERYANELAARRRRPWVPWPRDSELVQRAAWDLVADLDSDVTLRQMLAEVAVEQAARTWESYRPLAIASA